jgi:cytochrome b561
MERRPTVSLRDTPTTYGNISVFNHWALAVVVIALLASGLMITEVLGEEAGALLIPGHKWGGILAAVLVAWMLLWRWSHRDRPGALPGTPKPEAMARAGMHAILLGGTLVLTLSGIMMSIFSGHEVSVLSLVTIPAQGENEAVAGWAHQVHTVVGWVMVAAVAAHAAVGVKHHLVDHDETFTRMLGGQG